MITTELSALAGALFVLLAGANVWLMFMRLGSVRSGPSAARLTQAHRASGYLYLALYLVMLYFMFRRVQDAPDELAPRALVHMILGLTIAPLLFQNGAECAKSNTSQNDFWVYAKLIMMLFVSNKLTISNRIES